MRERTVRAVFYLSSVVLDKRVVSGTFHMIQRTVAEQAVDILAAFMTGIVFTVFVCKKGS